MGGARTAGHTWNAAARVRRSADALAVVIYECLFIRSEEMGMPAERRAEVVCGKDEEDALDHDQDAVCPQQGLQRRQQP